ncbi:MAG: LptF/LptG family permease [Bacteroidales bacterium]
MVKRIHLLVFKSYIGPLVMTFFIAEFVLIMHFLWLYIGDLVGKGLEFSVIAELLLYSSAGIVKMALPLAILLSSIMTFGSFGENFELSAMKSAGISLQKIMMPLTIFSILLSIGLFFFSNNVIPYTNLKFGSLLYDVGQQRPEMNIKPGVFNRDIEGFSIKIKNKSQTSNMMYGFMVYDHRKKKGNIEVTNADSGTMEMTENQKYMVITLYGGKSFNEMPDNNNSKKIYPEHHDYFDKETIIFEIPSTNLERSSPELFKSHYQMKPIKQLQTSVDSLTKALNNRTRQFEVTLGKSKFFKFEKKTTKFRDSSLTHEDSVRRKIRPEKLEVIMDFDSTYSAMNDMDKDRVLKAAIESSESLKAFVESNKNDIYERRKTINKHNIAWHEKFTLSFACLIFFFIGAPLGAIIRKGGFGLPFIVSIIFFIVYYLISVMGKKFAEEGVMLAWQGMWLSSVITLPLGIFFTYKATTDSALFDSGSYLELIKRPFKVLEINYRDPQVVFHKNVEIPENKVIVENMKNFNAKMAIVTLQLNNIMKKFSGVYRYHFKKERTDLIDMIETYNSLYDILAVKFRENKFMKANLEKFPRIDQAKYELTNSKRKANFFLLTIGIFPVGLLIILNSYLKLKVLKQKVEMVAEQLKAFEQVL